MIFDVLKATTTMSKWRGSEGSVRLRFEVVPADHEYLEIGDAYILCASRYLRFKGKERRPIEASVSVSTNPEYISDTGGKEPICGYAHFSPAWESRSGLDSVAAHFYLEIVVEPHVFDEMLRVAPAGAGAATLESKIEGLKFALDPDGSFWDLNDDSDCGDAERRRVTSFAYTVATFWTSEGDVRRAGERRFSAELADSPDPEDRKLAADLQPPEEVDPLQHLLRQCRTLLLAILGLVMLALVVLNR